MTNIFLRMPKFSLKYAKNTHFPAHGPKTGDFTGYSAFSITSVYKRGPFSLFYLDNPFISNIHLVDSVKMAAEDDVRKKERDPILTVCFVVLVLAFAVVGGIQINNSFFGGDSGPSATAGYTVEVDYNGSFYNFYDNDGSLIFDTSSWSIANDENHAKSFEFTLRAESSYEPLSFTVGDPKHGGLLPMFANAVTGMNKGDVARIVIDPANGYGALTEQMMKRSGAVFNVNVMESVPYDLFKKYYNNNEDIGGNMNGLTGPFGWKMNVKYTEGDKFVNVTHLAEKDKEYDMNDDVKVKVTAVTGSNITYELVIDYETYTQNFEGEFKDAKFENTYDYVKAVKVFLVDNEGMPGEYFLYAVENPAAPTNFVFKYIGTDAENKEIKETAGMFLCFVITVKSVS